MVTLVKNHKIVYAKISDIVEKAEEKQTETKKKGEVIGVYTNADSFI